MAGRASTAPKSNDPDNVSRLLAVMDPGTTTGHSCAASQELAALLREVLMRVESLEGEVQLLRSQVAPVPAGGCSDATMYVVNALLG